jgi:hypothetical protein
VILPRLEHRQFWGHHLWFQQFSLAFHASLISHGQKIPTFAVAAALLGKVISKMGLQRPNWLFPTERAIPNFLFPGSQAEPKCSQRHRSRNSTIAATRTNAILSVP